MKRQGARTVDCCGGVCWWPAGSNGEVFSTDSKERSQAEDPGGAEGTRRQLSCQETSPHSQDNAPCNTPQTPSCLCTLAWFATTPQIISFNLPLTQTLWKLPALRNFILYEAHFLVLKGEHFTHDRKPAEASSISKDPAPRLVQISRATVPVTRIETQHVLYSSVEVPFCFTWEQRPAAFYFHKWVNSQLPEAQGTMNHYIV